MATTPNQITLKMKGSLFRSRRRSNQIESFQQSVDPNGRLKAPESIMGRHASSVVKTLEDRSHLNQSMNESGPLHHQWCYACSQKSPMNPNHRSSQGELHSIAGGDQ